MNKHFIGLWLVMIVFGLCSCASPVNVAYFQNAESIRGMTLQPEQPLRLRPKDKISIVVNSADPMLVQQFNPTSVTQNMKPMGGSVTPLTSFGGGSGGGNSQMLAYTVDEQGDIEFPVLGKVAVKGKTRQEVAVYLQTRLISRDLVKDPIVTVEYVNLSVNVLGEVNRPGRIDILKDNFTILDAIAEAGDLTISGLRENVMVNREVEGEDQTYLINLCDRQQMLSSPAFYLQQNDVVYVAPNPKRRREAFSAGNAFNQPTLWISLASFFTTLGALLLR
jgi:polysaccharide export outer membrane protein